MLYQRNITQEIVAALQDNPVVLINGARQTGKSTLVAHLLNDFHQAEYYTFDDMATLASATQDPAGFVANLPEKVVIDEVQRVPEIFLSIKQYVDQNRQPGRFLLTGSSNALALPQIADSLAGRMEICTIWPLSQGELQSTRESFIDKVFQRQELQFKTQLNQAQWIEKFLTGSYPEAIVRADLKRRSRWYKSYITAILQRDVKSLANIEKILELPNILNLLAERSGNLLNTADISRILGIKATTLKRYIALLTQVFLVTFIPAWFNNKEKSLTKTPKVYINDTGLLCYLRGIDHDYLITNKQPHGAILENFVIMELLKQMSWSLLEVKLYHFRTQAGIEVDCVLAANNGQIVGIEVKASNTITKSDFNGLKKLAEISGSKFVQGILLYSGEKILPFGEKLFAVPVAAIWES
ncbi:MAG: hypothetical protein COC15_04615 [Legionellales bacterium]|nr:MAG: hypothetical protein COC15_04615 [Legionellales bacterium]